MRQLILGTAGHIDHGKTTLIRALTGVDTDRLPEERRRGITIDLGFARLAVTEQIELGIVDVPGHEAFIRNMLAGATGIDLALLVVAADEGVMPQTREHLAIIDLLGVRGAVVAVTKADLVEPAWLELVLDELREELAATAFRDVPLLPVSGTTGAGIDALRQALADAAGAVAQRGDDDLFRLPVDRVFTVRGTGTVVTGTVWSGVLRGDATLRILPAGMAARVRGLQAHGHDVARVGAGQRAAVALAGIEREALRRGDVLVLDPAWTQARMLTCRLRVLPGTGWEVRMRQRVRFHLGTAEVMARVVPLEGTTLRGGDEGWVQLRLEAGVVARAGDRFVVRSYSPITTIGGGVIAEPDAPRRNRLSPDLRERLTRLDGPVDEAIAARVALAGPAGVPADRLPIDTPFPPAAVNRALAGGVPGVLRIGDLLLPAGAGAAAVEALVHAVEACHRERPLEPGIDREELRRALPPGWAPELAEWALGRLQSEGRLEARGSIVARTGYTPVLTASQAGARARILSLLEDGGLAPPTLPAWPRELRERQDVRALLRLLEGDGLVVALGPELYVARSVLERAEAEVRRALAGGRSLSAAELKEVLPVSRKYLIPLLEHLDAAGVTARRGEVRVLAQ